jgi:hypothetical protein
MLPDVVFIQVDVGSGPEAARMDERDLPDGTETQPAADNVARGDAATDAAAAEDATGGAESSGQGPEAPEGGQPV